MGWLRPWDVALVAGSLVGSLLVYRLIGWVRADPQAASAAEPLPRRPADEPAYRNLGIFLAVAVWWTVRIVVGNALRAPGEPSAWIDAPWPAGLLLVTPLSPLWLVGLAVSRWRSRRPLLRLVRVVAWALALGNAAFWILIASGAF